MFYVINDGGYRYVLPALAVHECSLRTIEDGPFSAAQDAHNRLGGIEVEAMLGETGSNDIHLGEIDHCDGCGQRLEECMCVAVS